MILTKFVNNNEAFYKFSFNSKWVKAIRKNDGVTNTPTQIFNFQEFLNLPYASPAPVVNTSSQCIWISYLEN